MSDWEFLWDLSGQELEDAMAMNWISNELPKLLKSGR